MKGKRPSASLRAAKDPGAGAFLPRYYRFAKYFLLACIEFFVVLLIAWSFPGEKIVFLLKEFFPFLLLIAIFLYLYFLVIEHEAKKHLQARKELEEKNSNLNLLVLTSHRLSHSLDLKRRIRGGFAGLTRLLAVRKGFVLLSPADGKPEVAATYHVSRRHAEAVSGRLREERRLGPEGPSVPDPGGPLPLDDRDGDGGEWKDLQVVTLPAKKGSLGFLVIDAAIPEKKRETLELLCREMAAGMENSLLHREVEKYSITDPLTALYNLRFFYRRLGEELNRSRRFSLPFSLMLSDIDDFKSYVDGNGHRMGDQALKKIGELARDALRKIDVVARYGGDEFAYLLPQTGAKNARIVAQRIKTAVDNYSFPARNGFANLTLSIGIASFPDDAQDSDALMERSDRALFQAKAKGKNRVHLWKE